MRARSDAKEAARSSGAASSTRAAGGRSAASLGAESGAVGAATFAREVTTS